jgi:hypothetical protein
MWAGMAPNPHHTLQVLACSTSFTILLDHMRATASNEFLRLICEEKGGAEMQWLMALGRMEHRRIGVQKVVRGKIEWIWWHIWSVEVS